MSRKTPYNLTKFKEIQQAQIEEYRNLARHTKDPAIRDLVNFVIRDLTTCTKIHAARLKLKIK